MGWLVLKVAVNLVVVVRRSMVEKEVIMLRGLVRSVRE